MKTFFCGAVLLLVVAGLSRAAGAMVIADSVADFSGVQGDGGWFYGFVDRGQPTDPFMYDPATDFEEFAVFDGAAGSWGATVGQVGSAENSQFLSLDADGGHPTGIGPGGQDSIIWATRRYVSAFDGLVDIAFDVKKENVVNSRGGGITGLVFIDGVEVFDQMIGNFDGVGVSRVLTRPVVSGTVIDFVIDPTGVSPGSDGDYSARADGSIFTAVISESDGAVVPEPVSGALGLMGLGFLGVATGRRR